MKHLYFPHSFCLVLGICLLSAWGFGCAGTAWGGSPETTEAPRFVADAERPIRVACVGDSMTRFNGAKSYPSQLGEMLGDGWEFGNFGHNGAVAWKNAGRSYWDLPEFEATTEFAPDIVILMLGTNDAASRMPQRGQFVEDYTDLIKHFQSLESQPLVMICTPPPLMPGRSDERMNTLANEICPHIRQIGLDLGLEVIEMQTDPALQSPELYRDKVHTTPEGSGVMADIASKHLLPLAEPRTQ